MKKLIFIAILTFAFNFCVSPVNAAMEIIVDNDNSTSAGMNIYSNLSNFSYHSGSGYRNDYRKCQIRDKMEVSSYGWRFYTQFNGM
ncbi:hypothetical protein [Thomasclavelia cocleata]|uniref:hypothetical protein n=1 Tax=Thomasclavelia cocleata TaxID=69824 RepID=UPI00241CBC75|nr:hypothetical protein [Thomasclavelia cocleata]MCI9630431.1 hypothetical protein [Thomasclavelia cocleata]